MADGYATIRKEMDRLGTAVRALRRYRNARVALDNCQKDSDRPRLEANVINAENWLATIGEWPRLLKRSCPPPPVSKKRSSEQVQVEQLAEAN